MTNINLKGLTADTLVALVEDLSAAATELEGETKHLAGPERLVPQVNMQDRMYYMEHKLRQLESTQRHTVWNQRTALVRSFTKTANSFEDRRDAYPIIKALADFGWKIPAIKLYRTITGLGLKEVKEAIESTAIEEAIAARHQAFEELQAEVARLENALRRADEYAEELRSRLSDFEAEAQARQETGAEEFEEESSDSVSHHSNR